MPLPEWALNPIPTRHRYGGESGRHHSVRQLAEQAQDSLWWQSAAGSGALGDSLLGEAIKSHRYSDAFYSPTLPNFFSRSGRQTQIEGLRHGGAASARRRQHTEFGSGYRGLIAATPEMLGAHISGVAIEHAANWDLARQHLMNVIPRMEPARAARLQRDLAGAEKYIAQTGYYPIFINENVKGQSARAYIRHERIHAAHMKNADHPFFAQEARRSPDWKQGLRNDIEHRYKNLTEETIYFERAAMPKELHLPMEYLLKQATPDFVKAQAAMNYQQNVAGYEAKFASFPKDQARLYRESEALAYGNMYDKQFFSRMRNSGLPLPQNLGKQLVPEISEAAAVVSNVMTAGSVGAKAGVWQKLRSAGSRIMSRAL